jgi:xanthine dehydrogenase YagR molybdenum-binding subunit
VLNKAEQLLQGQPDPAEQTPGDRVKHGRGWAVCAWPSGGGLPAAAKVELLRNGDIHVSTGVVESGSGLRTCLAQIVAEEFQVDPLTIRVSTGDSAATPPGPAGCGGAAIASAGPAVRAAAVHLMEQLRELVGALPEMHGVSFSIADGRLCDDNHPEDTIPLSTVMEKIGRQSLVGEGYRGPNPEDISIRSFGLHRADVAVDMGLGTVRVTSYFALHESGLIVNPLTARTHVEGAVIEGISRALFQDPLEDPVTGRRLLIRNPSAGLAGSKDFPQIDFAFTTDIDAAANAIAAKGLNGASVLPVAAAIANAVYNATGIPVTELPMTPERLLHAWDSGQGETA